MVSANGMSVMIVESPAKAGKIQQFLGPSYKVVASYGHIRDLAKRQGSVQPDEDFKMTWEFTLGSAPRYRAIEDAVRSADKVIFATDPDREGEAISWHVAQELDRAGLLRGRRVERVMFTDITQQAVERALHQPRQVSEPLVDAYMARRALDYLVGFNVSPLLWRKLPGAKSAGRVQSVTLRLVCEREQERFRFKTEQYWTVEVLLTLTGNKVLNAKVAEVDGKALKPMQLKSEREAQVLADRISSALMEVVGVTTKLNNKSPPAPFTTSTLQQEAARRLGFPVAHTMRVAQQLYEGTSHQGDGLISYMRTDSVQMSPESVKAVRQAAADMFGKHMLSKQPRVYKSRAKNSQEAHEAIRPTHPQLHPDQLPSTIDQDQKKLYKLIWSRAMASQMMDATIQQVAAEFGSSDGKLRLRSTGSHVQYPGYLQAYGDLAQPSKGGVVDPDQGDPGEDESQQGDQDRSGPHKTSSDRTDPAILLGLRVGQPVLSATTTPTSHSTRPPGRYTEASLIKAMEQLGIGRPSTYAATLAVLQERKYVSKQAGSLIPTAVGLDLTTFLARFFTQYVDYQFTSTMEDQLDDVSSGQLAWRTLLKDFWHPFQSACNALKDVSITEVYDWLDQTLEPFEFPTPESRVCPQCKTGRLQRKPSKFGSFIGCSNFSDPDIKCVFNKRLTWTSGEDTEPNSSSSRDLGSHPVTGLPVQLKVGPFGPYVQTEMPPVTPPAGRSPKAATPRRASIPKHLDVDTLTLDDALSLLELPKQLGVHPADQQPILANQGKFGPYVQHGKVFAPVPKETSLLDVTLEQALEFLEQKISKPKQGATALRVRKPSPSPTSGDASATPAVASRPATTTAYYAFCRQMRPEVKARHPDASGIDVTRMLAAAWAQLTLEEKRSYIPQVPEGGEAQEDGQQLVGGETELDGEESLGSPPEDISNQQDWYDRQSQSPQGDRDPSRFDTFCTAMRPHVRIAHPSAEDLQVATLLKDAWKRLGEDQRQEFSVSNRPSASRSDTEEDRGEQLSLARAGRGAGAQQGRRSSSPSPSPGRRVIVDSSDRHASPPAARNGGGGRGGRVASRSPSVTRGGYGHGRNTDRERGRSGSPPASTGNGSNSPRPGSPSYYRTGSPSKEEDAGFQAYVGTQWASMRKQHPGLTNASISALLRGQWRQLSPGQQQKYMPAAPAVGLEEEADHGAVEGSVIPTAARGGSPTPAGRPGSSVRPGWRAGTWDTVANGGPMRASGATPVPPLSKVATPRVLRSTSPGAPVRAFAKRLQINKQSNGADGDGQAMDVVDLPAVSAVSAPPAPSAVSVQDDEVKQPKTAPPLESTASRVGGGESAGRRRPTPNPSRGVSPRRSSGPLAHNAGSANTQAATTVVVTGEEEQPRGGRAQGPMAAWSPRDDERAFERFCESRKKAGAPRRGGRKPDAREVHQQLQLAWMRMDEDEKRQYLAC